MTREIFTEAYDRKSPLSWHAIKSRVAAIEVACFGDQAYTPAELAIDFRRRGNLSVLLWEGHAYDEYLIGYTNASPVKDKPGTWYINNTAIDPAYQGRGLVAKLMTTLYAELRLKGCEFVERDAAVENGYADKLFKLHYRDIVDTIDHPSQYGPQRFMRMRLPGA